MHGARLRPGREKNRLMLGSMIWTPSPVKSPLSSSSSIRERWGLCNEGIDSTGLSRRVDPSRWSTGKAATFIFCPLFASNPLSLPAYVKRPPSCPLSPGRPLLGPRGRTWDRTRHYRPAIAGDTSHTCESSGSDLFCYELRVRRFE